MLYGGIIKAWVGQDFSEARRSVLAVDLQDVPQIATYVRQLFVEWARLSPEESIHNLDLVPEDLHSIVITVATAGILDVLTPEDVLRLYADKGLVFANISGALAQVFNAWSEEDPAATLQWITENTEAGSVLREVGLPKALENFALADPLRAFETGLKEPMGDITPYSRGQEFSVIVSLVNNGRFEHLDSMLPRVRTLRESTHIHS